MNIQTVNATMSIPAVGEVITTVSEEGYPVTGMVVKSYPCIGVAIQSMSGGIHMIEDGRDYAVVGQN